MWVVVDTITADLSFSTTESCLKKEFLNFGEIAEGMCPSNCAIMFKF